MATKQEIGRKGEAIAKAYLLSQGYEILDENWRYRKAEVDLIGYKKGIMVFVEVKARSSTTFGEREDFVNEAKQSHLQRAAEEYLYIMDFKGEIRFDIISVLFDRSGNHKLKHIEDAFWG